MLFYANGLGASHFPRFGPKVPDCKFGRKPRKDIFSDLRTGTAESPLFVIGTPKPDELVEGVLNSKRGRKNMLYRKNIPGWERAVRVIAGLMMIAVGLFWMRGSAMVYVLAAMGVMAAMTGFIGYCPMCSIAGRTLEQK